MKRIILLLISICLALSNFAQNINVNPDKNGEPWIVGGLRIPSEQEIAKIPLIKIPEGYRTKELPASFDNSTNQYFRPVFNQTDGCCAQASGVAYNFTYELNRVRNTPANIAPNQYPTHYTYNFLNDGNGNNGSWMVDGWEIIQANGIPNISTYGSLDQTAQYWMSGYTDYESGMDNRVKEILAIDVSDLEGLETLKHWIYDHLDGSAYGSIVNFAAGISNTGFVMSGDKVISWGYPMNHAMTITGWDDNISYDYNNDGQITNNIDINNDGIVNMRDMEKGAVIMVNSWGTYWGNNGKAYIMYKLLAETPENGGIQSKKVFSINVKETQEPELRMRVKMNHNNRSAIKVLAGISTDINASRPEHILDFPLFNNQGGDFEMNGSNTNPIEVSFDISELLSYTAPSVDCKYFLMIKEDDQYSSSTGTIIDFSVIDKAENQITCAQHNLSIVNNDTTFLSLTKSTVFDAPAIADTYLPAADAGILYSYQMSGEGGSQPYVWKTIINYEQQEFAETFPAITSNQLPTTNNDDGISVKTLEFPFLFYGEYYNQVTVSTDGSIVFEPVFEYLRTEKDIMSKKMIAVFAADLNIYPAHGDGIFYQGDQYSATFRWKT